MKAVAAIVATLLAFMFFVILRGSHGHVCTEALISDKAVAELAAKSTAICAEFWFNRYQTSLAALVAIWAGVLAWKGPVAQLSFSVAQDLRRELQTLRKIRSMDRDNFTVVAVLCDLSDVRQAIEDPEQWKADRWPAFIKFRAGKLREVTISRDQTVEQYRGMLLPGPLDSAMVEFAEQMTAAMGELKQFHGRLIRLRHSHPDRYLSEVVLTEGVLDAFLQELEHSYEQLGQALDEDIANVTRQIRATMPRTAANWLRGR